MHNISIIIKNHCFSLKFIQLTGHNQRTIQFKVSSWLLIALFSVILFRGEHITTFFFLNIVMLCVTCNCLLPVIEVACLLVRKERYCMISLPMFLCLVFNFWDECYHSCVSISFRKTYPRMFTMCYTHI